MIKCVRVWVVSHGWRGGSDDVLGDQITAELEIFRILHACRSLSKLIFEASFTLL